MQISLDNQCGYQEQPWQNCRHEGSRLAKQISLDNQWVQNIVVVWIVVLWQNCWQYNISSARQISLDHQWVPRAVITETVGILAERLVAATKSGIWSLLGHQLDNDYRNGHWRMIGWSISGKKSAYAYIICESAIGPESITCVHPVF